VFVLKEVFGYPYAEIARALDRTETSVRQLGTRARKHVEARRPRFEAGGAERRAATERFLDAVVGGDINRLMETLAPDVTLWTDGGGKVRQALRPIVGAETVAAWFAALGTVTYQGVSPADRRPEPAEINGAPGMIFRAPDRVLATITLDLDESGRIVGIHNVANPDKLHAIADGPTYQV